MISASDALIRLQDGNRRFAADNSAAGDSILHPARSGSCDDQQPFAIILGCSDSRVPAEIVFDQGLGDLFVIRVAGNVVAPTQIGSVEFAAAKFGTRLVVVLGHTQCGAIITTLQQLKQPHEEQSPNMRVIVDRVRLSVEPLMDSNQDDEDILIQKAVRANIEASVDQLKHGSDILEALIREQHLMVVGAEYSLTTGEVVFFD